jgi:DNA helicase HerA-like ATPase
MSMIAAKTPDTNHPFPISLIDNERMGRIVAVTGAHAIILLDSHEGPGNEDKRGAEIGTLLKVETAGAITLALISALSSPMPTHNTGERELRIVEVEFIGELPRRADGSLGSFRRGVSSYPSLGDTVFRATRAELALAYACDEESAVRVGYIQQDPSIPAMVKIDEMLGKHFAILGTTGTGKSCSVALVLRRILEKSPQAHVLLLDVHREYAQCFRGMSEVITPDNMALPFWLLNFDEAAEILVGQHAHREADVEVLREIIPIAKARFMGNRRTDRSGIVRGRDALIDNNIGVDTPIPYRTSDLVAVLEEYIGKLELRGELAPYKRLKAKVEAVSRDPRYAFMFGSLTVQDNMSAVLARLFRIPVNGKPIAIIELGGLPSEIINVVVSVLARLAFDFAVWSAGRIPITFVCEEAHRYVPSDKAMGFEPTKRAISKIAKEGRKYGVSLCIVSQRPAELDPTILSQCNTVFSLRLTNERDQEILKAGISDAASSLLEFMPTMGVGEAITFGEGVALPTRIKFDLLPSNELPGSNTASFTKNWAKDLPDDTFLNEVVNRWRAQTYNPDSADYSVENNDPVEPAAAQIFAAQPHAPHGPTASQRTSLRREPMASPVPAAPQGFGRMQSTQPLTPPPAPSTGGAPQSLASLIKQFRT